MFYKHPMRNTFIISCLSIVALTACGAGNTETNIPVTGPWSLDADESRISFVTIKKQDLAEPGTFTGISGRVSANGEAQVTIALDTVETWNETRDPRMREFLFETGKYPFTNITAAINLPPLLSLENRGRTEVTIPLSVEMHGVNVTYDAQLIVTHLGEGTALVETATPILVHAEDFALVDGVARLRELALLPSIIPVVPVSFSLVFVPEL